MCVCIVHWHCTAQLSMFNMEKRFRNKIIIIIIIICPSIYQLSLFACCVLFVTWPSIHCDCLSYFAFFVLCIMCSSICYLSFFVLSCSFCFFYCLPICLLPSICCFFLFYLMICYLPLSLSAIIYYYYYYCYYYYCYYYYYSGMGIGCGSADFRWGKKKVRPPK